MEKVELKNSQIDAHDAEAKNQWSWVEKFLSDHLLFFGRGSITKSERIELKHYQNGFDFLVNARKIELDEFMAKPSDPIKTTMELSGLVSGLNLDKNERTIPDLAKIDDDFIGWAKWYRFGSTLAASLSKKEIPIANGKLRDLISNYPQK